MQTVLHFITDRDKQFLCIHLLRKLFWTLPLLISILLQVFKNIHKIFVPDSLAFFLLVFEISLQNSHLNSWRSWSHKFFRIPNILLPIEYYGQLRFLFAVLYFLKSSIFSKCHWIHSNIQCTGYYLTKYNKISKIRLNGSHIISEIGIYCSM